MALPNPAELMSDELRESVDVLVSSSRPVVEDLLATAEERIFDVDLPGLAVTEGVDEFEGAAPPRELLHGTATSHEELRQALEQVDLRWRLDTVLALGAHVRRAARRVSMRIISDLSELDVFGTDQVTPEVFASAAREVVAGLEDLPRRIKPGDDIDARTLLSFVRSRLDVLPETQQELDRALERLREAAARRWEAMDAWERLDIDWSVFAADARERFDDPFFFDPGDEEAPHGNDAGADLLAAYLTERPHDGLDFLEAQLRVMGYESLSDFANIDIWEQDEMVIAAVFAELMVCGSTSAELKQLALQALDRREAEAPSPRNEQMRRALNWKGFEAAGWGSDRVIDTASARVPQAV